MLLCQASSQQEVASLKEQRDRAETKHEMELTALSSNLAAVRQQVDSSQKKMDVSDAKVKGLTQQLEGKYICTYICMYTVACFLNRIKP